MCTQKECVIIYMHQKKCTRLSIEALFIITAHWKAPKSPCSMDEDTTVYSHSEILYSKNDPAATPCSIVWVSQNKASRCRGIPFTSSVRPREATGLLQEGCLLLLTGWLPEGNKGSFWDSLFLDLIAGSLDVSTLSKFLGLYTLDLCNFLCVCYTSIKVVFCG